jgi:hypothetical protein
MWQEKLIKAHRVCQRQEKDLAMAEDGWARLMRDMSTLQQQLQTAHALERDLKLKLEAAVEKPG